VTDDCVDCQPASDTCEWAGCRFQGDYVLRDLTVVRGGKPIVVGDVTLCGGHKRRAERLGRVTLDWDRILKAANP
jgi:hypothetical protein